MNFECACLACGGNEDSCRCDGPVAEEIGPDGVVRMTHGAYLSFLESIPSWRPLGDEPKDARLDLWVVHPDHPQGGRRETDCSWDGKEWISRNGALLSSTMRDGVWAIRPTHWIRPPAPPKA